MMHFELTGDTHPNLEDKNLKIAKKHEELKLPLIDPHQKKPLSAIRTSENPFPRKTSQLIGWKSTDSDWKLEKYGRYLTNSRGQIGIYKLFNWPQEGIN